MADEKDTPAEDTVAPAVEESPKAAAPAKEKESKAESEAPVKSKKKRPGVAPRRGKKVRNQLKNQTQKVKAAGVQSLAEALKLLRSMKRAKFDETVEVHMNLGIDPTQSDQMIRGSVSLPNGIGKSVRVVVFCQGDNVAKAQAAGADFAGGSDLVEKIQKENWLDFDVAITTQDMMPQVARLGKVLGPRGLMPTPKAGTVVPATGDLAAAVTEFKAGKVEYRSDKTGQIHAGVGKISFDDTKLIQNITAFVEAVRAAKPSGVKGNYIRGITISATMSPGLPVSM